MPRCLPIQIPILPKNKFIRPKTLESLIFLQTATNQEIKKLAIQDLLDELIESLKEA